MAKPTGKSITDQSREFEDAISRADRVLVEKRNALGEMDVAVFPASIARFTMQIKDTR